MREAADLLVPALGAIYQLDRLFDEAQAPSRTWEDRTLVPEVTRARQFLDVAYEYAGWQQGTPKGDTK